MRVMRVDFFFLSAVTVSTGAAIGLDDFRSAYDRVVQSGSLAFYEVSQLV